MKQILFADMTVHQLVQRFTAIALDQDRALLRNEYAKFNRLFKEMEAIKHELQARAGDQRRALLSLYDHPNAQVRLKAVKATLAVEPDSARRMLELIADSREYPQAGEAGMTIDNLDSGVFKPT
jgi:hypothetical protein